MEINNEKVYVYAFAERPAAYRWVSQQPGSWLVELPAGKAALGKWCNHTSGAIAPAPDGGEIPDRVHFSVSPWIIESAHRGQWNGDIPRPEQFTISARPGAGEEGNMKKLYKVLSHEPCYPDSTRVEVRGVGIREALREVMGLRRAYLAAPDDNPSYAEIWPEKGEGQYGFVGNYFFNSSQNFNFYRLTEELAAEIKTIHAVE